MAAAAFAVAAGLAGCGDDVVGAGRERAAAPVRVGAFELRSQTFRGRPEALRVARDGGVALTLTFGDTHTVARASADGSFTARPAPGTLPGTRIDRRLAADGSGATTTLFAPRLLARTFDAAGREASARPLPGRYVPGTAQLSLAPDGSGLLGWQERTGPGRFRARLAVRRPGRSFGPGRTLGRGELALQAGPGGDGLVVLRSAAGGHVWVVRDGRLGPAGSIPASVTDMALALGADGTAVVAETRDAGGRGTARRAEAGPRRADRTRDPGARRADRARDPGAQRADGARDPGARRAEAGTRDPGARRADGARDPGARRADGARDPGARRADPARDPGPRRAGHDGPGTTLWTGVAEPKSGQPPVVRRLGAQAGAAPALAAAVGSGGEVAVAWGRGGATELHDGPGLRRRTRVALAPGRLQVVAGAGGRLALLSERGPRVGVALRLASSFAVVDDVGARGALGPAGLTPDGLVLTRSIASTATAPSRTEVVRLRP